LDAESLDRELAAYWVKKGDSDTAKAHLDNELDDYWKNEATNASANEVPLLKNAIASPTYTM